MYDIRKNKPSKSGIFMIELVINIGLFALCAAVSIGIFVRAELMSRTSYDLVKATGEVRNIIECWKSYGGDMTEVASKFSANVEGKAAYFYYDDDWNLLEASDVQNQSYVIRVAFSQFDRVSAINILVTDITDGKELLKWNDISTLRFET